jgi:NADH dehydrogenase
MTTKPLRIAITGGTGFVGRNLARQLTHDGHQVVLLARGLDRTDAEIRHLPAAQFVAIGLDDPAKLAAAFAGCDAVVHSAGINREMDGQTFQRVHVEGTHHVVAAARMAGVRKIALISFLRARPDCGSAYHESKFAAEEIVRSSGLDFTVFKCGVIYGRGDHMLDHLSHAFHTFPLFAFVGFQDKNIRPNAVEDVTRLVATSVTTQTFSRRTIALLGPEELTLRAAVRRVARVTGKKPFMFPLPVWFHYALGWVVERIMTVPLVSVAQVRMLSEGLSEPQSPCDLPPPELAPRIPFSEEQIRRGLPPAARFGTKDIRCCQHHGFIKPRHIHRAFLELP